MHNPIYNDPAAMAAIRRAWKAERSVALAGFLDDKGLSAIMREASGGWKRAYAPDRHRYEEKRIALPGARGFVKAITGRPPLSGTAMRFGAGDYTILHDQDAQRPGVVALLFLEDWDERWGGYVAFMKDGETLHRFTPRRNTLLIVERKKGVRYFVKYVNRSAGRRKLVILQI